MRLLDVDRAAIDEIGRQIEHGPVHTLAQVEALLEQRARSRSTGSTTSCDDHSNRCARSPIALPPTSDEAVSQEMA